jgi:diguanylate cyclase (GGDEF)-like protein
VAANPHLSAAHFDEWATAVHALERFPELQDIGLIELVPASELGAFRARMLAHPILATARQPARYRGGYQVVPAGSRPYYCFATTGVVRPPIATLPPGMDYCALEPTLLGARDSGRGSYVPFPEGKTMTLAVQIPVYRGGVTPSTVAGRRRAFVGWLGESLVPKIVLGAALQGHPNFAVTFRYRSAQANVVFGAGNLRRGAESSTIDLGNGWTVQSFGVVAGGRVLADGHALSLLIGGASLSLLLGLLIFVLATGRIRAMSLVRDKTRELSYRAMHDNLTGLPNRALVIDRAEQMLSLPSLAAAALFVDIDGFKHVNDSFGHAAGDRLLQVIGERLQNVVRQGDIVGRLGGDEFVMLLESRNASEPAIVAERLIEAVRKPITIDDEGSVVTVSASVGIAVGHRRVVDELLRDADLALYAAKAAGKDRYMLFEADMTIDSEGQITAPAKPPVTARHTRVPS